MTEDFPDVGRCYDVLISYRREDESFAEQLAGQLLDRFGISAFIDKKSHPPGYPWQQQWLDALRRKPAPEENSTIGPGVIVLATAAMEGDRPDQDQVVREIADAVLCSSAEHGIPIAPLRFHAAGFKALSERVSNACNNDILGARHWPEPLYDIGYQDPARITPEDWDRICFQVARVARASMLRRLQFLRNETLAWANGVGKRFFSQLDLSSASKEFAEIRIMLERAEAETEAPQLAIVGQGGTGKTAQLAQAVKRVCSRPNSRLFPVLLTTDELEHGPGSIKHKLGLGPSDDLSAIEELHSWAQGRLLFVVDSLERSANLSNVLTSLTGLQEKAVGILITCRSSVWRQTANEALKLSEKQVLQVSNIGDDFIAKALERPIHFVAEHPFLRQALFVDIAAHLLSETRLSNAQKERALRSQTALLDELQRWATETDNRAQDRESLTPSALKLLSELARQQLRERGFSISPASLFSASGGIRRPADDAYEHLRDQRPYLLEESMHGDAVVRLRHDSIDANNVARLLIEEPDAFLDVLAIAELGFSQIVLESVAQRAADINGQAATHSAPILQIFEAFLRGCDNKNDDDRFNRLGWSVGYVLQNKIHVFQGLLRESLKWEYQPKLLPRKDGPQYSELRQLSQRTLSSIASMFLGARPLELKDEDGSTIQLLQSLIVNRNVEYKARLVEALARFDDGQDGGGRFLLKLCEDADFIKQDPGISAYLADALHGVAKGGLSSLQAGVVLSALDDLLEIVHDLAVSNRKIEFPALRKLIVRRNQVAAQLNQPAVSEFELTELEYKQAFALHHPGNPRRVSDWRIFNEYAERLKSESDTASISENTILAIGQGLWHDMVNCHVAAVRCLATIDHPFARAIILHAIATRSDDRLEEACVAALESQGKLLRNRKTERSSLAVALARACAQRWAYMPGSRTKELSALLSSLGWAGERVVTAGGIELASVHSSAATMNGRSVTVSHDVAELLYYEHTLDPGPELERKVALDLDDPLQAGPVSMQLSESSWGVPRRLHVSIGHGLMNVPITRRADFRQDDTAALHDLSVARHVETIARCHRLFEAFMCGSAPIPHILCLHAIVLTADRQLIRTRRSKKAEYHPGGWSTSFEEQLKIEDVASDANLVRSVAIRGIHEEFGIALEQDQIDLGDAVVVLEWPSMNLCIMSSLEVRCTSAEMSDGALAVGDELIEAEALPMKSALTGLISPYSGVYVEETSTNEHPTSLTRMAILARQLKV